MFQSDFEVFNGLLSAVSELYGKPPSAMVQSLYWGALREYDLATIRQAFDRHVRNPDGGQFMPKPADIIRTIASRIDDGRPGVEEAWAMIPRDEATSVVWTSEMAEAWGIAQPLLNEGDPVAARMAFKEAYSAILSRVREERKPVQWIPSLGDDKHGRESVLLEAVRKNRLAASHVARLLPPGEISPQALELLERVKATALMQVPIPSAI